MKRSNVMTIIILSIFSLIGSYYGVKAVMGDPSSKKETIIQPVVVSSDLAMPDPEVFNPGAVNPTIEVYIGSCIDINQNGILEPTEKLECATPDNAKRQPNKKNNNEGKKDEKPKEQTETKKPDDSTNKPSDQTSANKPSTPPANPQNPQPAQPAPNTPQSQDFVAPPQLGPSQNITQENLTTPPDLSKERS